MLAEAAETPRRGEDGGLLGVMKTEGRASDGGSVGRAYVRGKDRISGVCVGRSYCDSGNRRWNL